MNTETFENYSVSKQVSRMAVLLLVCDFPSKNNFSLMNRMHGLIVSDYSYDILSITV